MIKQRQTIPKAIQESVLKEYNHRCAFCGGDRPHLHHIDENPGNSSDPLNLIPLCPNCHLSDQHDATNSIPIDKLKFFRRYKHRSILKPQFDAIFRRMRFLHVIDNSEMDSLFAQAEELTRFVQHLEMGMFYAGELAKLLSESSSITWRKIDGRVEEIGRPERVQKYRNQLQRNCPMWNG